MPFLPFVPLIAWQALARSASFALRWATSLFFGQVPGNRGYLLSVMALVAVAWVVVLVGFALPLGIGFVAERAGWVSRNFNLDAFEVWSLVAAIRLAPPILAGVAEFAAFEGPRASALPPGAGAAGAAGGGLGRRDCHVPSRTPLAA